MKALIRRRTLNRGKGLSSESNHQKEELRREETVDMPEALHHNPNKLMRAKRGKEKVPSLI